MKSYRILWIKDEYIKHSIYAQFSSEGVAKAYAEGCRDGWTEGYEENVQVILAVDERTPERIKEHYQIEKENEDESK